MQLNECLEKRASYRSYNNKEVAWEDIMNILNAARMSPSSGNLQNWSFIIVQKPEIKEEISKAALNQVWINQAPVVIVVCSRLENIKRHYGERGENLYAIQNCAAAINNILLKATDLGMASCWINAFDDNAIKRILKMPDSVVPQGIVTIGYSNEKIEKMKRYELDLLIHFDEWNGKKAEGLFPLKEHGQDAMEGLSGTTAKTRNFFSGLFARFKRK